MTTIKKQCLNCQKLMFAEITKKFCNSNCYREYIKTDTWSQEQSKKVVSALKEKLGITNL